MSLVKFYNAGHAICTISMEQITVVRHGYGYIENRMNPYHRWIRMADLHDTHQIALECPEVIYCPDDIMQLLIKLMSQSKKDYLCKKCRKRI